MDNQVAVVDYGIGNLFSVCRALEHCSANVELTGEPEKIRQATKVLLPGVGAFDEGMSRLDRYGLADAIRQCASNGGLLFGVCLGMQLLLDSSKEFGAGEGLGLIPGEVLPLPLQFENEMNSKIPHIGWSDLVLPDGRSDWWGSLLETTEERTAMYFLHSFMAVPSNPEHRLAECIYDGTRIPALIGYENIWGAQFHPEKSGEAGLNILREFVKR